MRQEDAAAFTKGCFNGEPASCTFACPYRLDIRSFLEKAEKGRWNAAYKTLRNAVVFPVIACALCPVPCESSCQRTSLGDEPLAMGLIEDACIRYAKSRKPDSYVIPPKTERIAVVGAGLAGLSGALSLAQKKFNVTVFDKASGWGGALRTHPLFAEFDEDIRLQFSAVDAEFKFDTEITSFGELSGYDAVFIATGRGGADFGLLSGWDSKLLTTSEPRVFLGGALTGADAAGSIVQGLRLSKTVEVFLQTGKASETYGDTDAAGCAHMLDHTGTPSAPRVIPAGPSGFTEDETKREAARCLKCDCTRCIDSCEMLSAFRKKPKKIAVEVFTDTQVNPPYSSHTLTRQAYSCNMCGHCKETCPEDSDIGGVLQLSRASRVESGQYPQALHDFWIREMDFYSGGAAFAAAPDGGACDYVFFPGCQLGAHNPEHVYKAYEFLAENYNSGIYLGCCGAPAYWAGDTARQDENFERIRETAKTLGNPKFVFACATCESVFEKFLPEISRVSLYELLADSTEITPSPVFGNASVFDPCNARHNPGLESAVRSLAEKSGSALYELPEKNRCCGWGGHMMVANPELFDKITENRAAMGANPYIVYCANCREVFARRGKECVHVLDMAFNLPPGTRVPDIETKHRNALAIKEKLMKDITGSEFSPAPNEWDALELTVPEALADSIDRKLISLSDVKEAIWRSETTGDRFVDEESGVYRCSMEKPVLTYWVTYKKSGVGFELLEAYCHRMRFSKEDAQ